MRLHFLKLDREFFCLQPSLARLYSAAASPSERLRSDGSLVISRVRKIQIDSQRGARSNRKRKKDKSSSWIFFNDNTVWSLYMCESKNLLTVTHDNSKNITDRNGVAVKSEIKMSQYS